MKSMTKKIELMKCCILIETQSILIKKDIFYPNTEANILECIQKRSNCRLRARHISLINDRLRLTYKCAYIQKSEKYVSCIYLFCYAPLHKLEFSF
ncbi:hypothetical protein BpHYR1_043259 [Brachionus plicatilis]|uniref:Uncharacterized protein n=1 Tax=Brachionus plicatilis TaxID=10195 RepID=A0A3M7P9J8_BRAPC|nr:hypothetical protein BpHYR1_043259 [Brachionus plicatilis]